MKITKVLLRWYKSFNTSYDSQYGADRRPGKERPWNHWKLPGGQDEVFPFVEIPVDHDITTIVGANESGKSHLLNAISMVVTGRGIPGDPFSRNSESKPYAQTDLCHFASLLSKNLDLWPHVGVEFTGLTKHDVAGLKEALAKTVSAEAVMTLILTNEEEDCSARLYLDSELMRLNREQLAAVRKCLPQVMFINSQLAIADEVPLSDLLAAYGHDGVTSRTYYPIRLAQDAAALLFGMSLTRGAAVDPKVVGEVEQFRGRLSRNDSTAVPLELMLFRDVLGIEGKTLEKLFHLEDADRGHAESLIALWNEEIERKLNLSRYWQQDQDFSLKLNYKKGVLYFEITDKTGCVYTFRERSSGLRYFLSYYIQAKALETKLQDRESIILMDEPDSFLSILGQRNLLSIFESLVNARLSSQRIQLLYTTHSPFLINRNFPARIRLVRKGDGEEGTQFVEQSRTRRFEPVRSALGIDLAQTLFMGGTNILLEGPVDQFLISELIRIFAGTEGTSDLLDLNSVVLVSAESAPGVEQVLVASQWSDEPIPTAIVVLDGDDAGKTVRNRITGKTGGVNEFRGLKQLVPSAFVSLISEIIEPYGTNLKIVTTEDIIPVELFKEGIGAYLKRWVELTAEQKSAIATQLASPTFSAEGLATGTLESLRAAKIINGKSFDKMGIAQEIVALVRNGGSSTDAGRQVLENLLRLSRFLRAKIEDSGHAEKLRSGKQAISRIVGDFFTKNKAGSTPYELELVFGRLERETVSFGEDADSLRRTISNALLDLKKLRDSGQQMISGDDWNAWFERLERLRKNPLASFAAPSDPVSPSQAVRLEEPSTSGTVPAKGA